jgi:hypothetical protein
MYLMYGVGGGSYKNKIKKEGSVTDNLSSP